jgi:hypothetical protein
VNGQFRRLPNAETTVHAPDLLAKYMGVPLDTPDALAITDPYKAVEIDVNALRSNPNFPGSFTVAGRVRHRDRQDCHRGSAGPASPGQGVMAMSLSPQGTTTRKGRDAPLSKSADRQPQTTITRSSP